MAKCVVELIRQNRLDLATFLVDDVPSYDPRRPDPPETFKIPASPMRTNVTPEGN